MPRRLRRALQRGAVTNAATTVTLPRRMNAKAPTPEPCSCCFLCRCRPRVARVGPEQPAREPLLGKGLGREEAREASPLTQQDWNRLQDAFHAEILHRYESKNCAELVVCGRELDSWRMFKGPCELAPIPAKTLARYPPQPWWKRVCAQGWW